MTKADIVEAVYARLREQGVYSKRDAADIVESVFDTMKDALGSGEKIKVSGFGNFVVERNRSALGVTPRRVPRS